MRLSHHDLGRVQAALRRLGGVASVDGARRCILETTAGLVGNSWVSFNESSLKPGRASCTLCEPAAPSALASYFPTLHALMHQHPILRRTQVRGPSPALTFGDCMPRRAAERLPLFNEYYRQVGTRDQLVMLLRPGRELMRSVSVNRSRASFTARDRGVMDLLRPHFEQAHRRATLLEDVVGLLGSPDAAGGDGRGRGLMAVDAAGRVEFASREAGLWLSAACRDRVAEGAPVPAEVRAWLRTQELGPDAGFSPLQLPVADGKVLLRIGRRADDRALVVVEKIPGPDRIGIGRLTPREREVLAWVARGKTNPEIAVILGAGQRTIEKHLENILAKLAVENRAGAMLIALERGLGPA